MLEFDGQALDPAIVSAQPMKPGHTVDLQQLACAPGDHQLPSPPCNTPHSLARQGGSGVRQTAVLSILMICCLSVCTVHTESRIPQTGTVPGQPEPTQVRKNYLLSTDGGPIIDQ